MEILKLGDRGGMVVGHTPQKKISHFCNKRLWMTDVGMSSAFGDKDKNSDRIELLEIINGKITRIIK